MSTRAVVFDIHGVLEIAPPLGATEQWDDKLGLGPGEVRERLHHVFVGGSVGAVTEEDVRSSARDLLGLDDAQVHAFMDDLWAEYLGVLNAELAEYFRDLRPRYGTAILSNSSVGARAKEQECYNFEAMTDIIVYSHEVGMIKPDPRIYELTCERLGVPPEEAIFLDDIEAAVEGAREVGMQAILYQDNAQAIADIEVRLPAR